MENYVSIGFLNSTDLKEQDGTILFFWTNGISAFLEGSVIFDVCIEKKDVEAAKNLLKRSRPEVLGFTSRWE